MSYKIFNRIIEQQESLQSMFSTGSLSRIIEQQESLQSMFSTGSLSRIIEQQESLQSMFSTGSLSRIIEQQESLQSIKLSNIFDFDNYYSQIEDCYEDLDNLCYESSMNYPENEMFFISIRKNIYNIKLYFFDQVGKLLDIESVDYRIWKPCLDRAIINSRDAIILFIYSLVTISIDMKSCLEKGNIFGVMFLPYVFNSEFNSMISHIKINLHKELELLGIDLNK